MLENFPFNIHRSSSKNENFPALKISQKRNNFSFRKTSIFSQKAINNTAEQKKSTKIFSIKKTSKILKETNKTVFKFPDFQFYDF